MSDQTCSIDLGSTFSLPASPVKPPLWDHQEKGLQLARDRFGFFWDTGTGKTRLTCELLKRDSGPSLILAPLSVTTLVWPSQIKEWGEELECISGVGKPRERKIAREKLLRDRSSRAVMVLGYDSFRIDAKEWAKAIHRFGPLGTLVLDESSKIKNPKAKRSKAVMTLSRRAKRVYLLAARPNPESLLELWSQMFCLDPSILGSNFFIFRSQHFHKPRPEKMPWLWEPKSERTHGFDAKKAIIDKVRPYCSFMSKEDCQDLPEKVSLFREVSLSDQEQRAYSAFMQDFFIRFDCGEVSASNALVEVMKARQLTTGLVCTDDREWIRLGKSKIKEIISVLQDEIPGEQAIVCCEYRKEVFDTAEALRAEGMTVSTAVGGLSWRQKEEIQKDWDSGKTRVIVANTQVIAYGLNLQHGRNMIWSTIVHGGDPFYQAESRIHRGGQTRSCNYFYLFALGTIDAKMLAKQTRKQEITLDFLEELRR